MKKMLFVLMTVILIFGMLLTSCAKETEEPTVPDDTGEVTAPETVEEVEEAVVEEEEDEEVSTMSEDITEAVVDEEDVVGLEYKQAPMLDGMDLPPVEERLPLNPKVITPLNEIGVYGGTFERPTGGGLDNYILYTHMAEPFFTYTYPNLGDGPPQPNLADKYEFNEEGNVLTITLREGVKWSDGVPMTTADFEFTWYDVWLNENALASVPGQFQLGGLNPDVEIIDDYTFRLIYQEPYYYAINALASLTPAQSIFPKHYLEQFHPDFNDDANWEDFNNELTFSAGNLGKVVINAWMTEEVRPGESITLVRNPYYWKVDTEGNQLPYMDRTRITIVEDRDTLGLKAVAGEFDSDGMWLNAAHLQLLKSEEEARGYTVGFWEGVIAMGVYFNMDVEEEALREIFRDVNFRRAFSVAIDREDINQTIYNGFLEKTGATLTKSTPFYTDEAAQMWADFDIALAQQILADAGYADSDGDGILEHPNGRELSFYAVVAADHSMYVPTLEIMKDTLAEAGIEIILEPTLQATVGDLRLTGDWEIQVWDTDQWDRPLDGGNGLVSWTQDDPDVDSGPYWHRDERGMPLDQFADFQNAILAAKSQPYDERVASLQEANLLFADQVWIVGLGTYVRPYYVGPRMGNHPVRAVRTPDVASAFMHFQNYIKP
jgi:peptide/nickel transport system substrate-binding protein